MLSSDRIVSLALDLGFDEAGVTPAFPVPTLAAYRLWVSRGFHGEMGYLAREDRVARRENPDMVLPGVRSVVCVGLNYYQGALDSALLEETGRGRISRYAWGIDYHDLMQPRLQELARRIIGEAHRGASYRCYVDTGPVLERAYAARAGLGFIGKNSCLISPRLGSWLFLGVILTDADLTPTSGRNQGGCGSCRRCIDACPTGAIVAPYVVDARRCLSYLTIELRDAIAEELRPLVENRVFGCDVCQEVCPWQRFARPTSETAFYAQRPEDVVPRLADLVGLTQHTFRDRYSGRAVARANRAGLVRNAIVALGNWGHPEAAAPLTRAQVDPDEMVQAHARWALDRIAGGKAITSTRPSPSGT
jgi:epoxyqueuosine reductase